ncbi:MAG: hypothetical protein M4579_000019 [Chaenotheca gracillima]|nr:MAG: hypothetical protein M4579_000019 [Chaenotheca gracillima]
MSKAADPARVRNNQRASRARRREYLETLELRVKQCEFRGAQASVEIQLAARKVARENALLRSLLKLQGVSESEIAKYLHRSDDSGSRDSTASDEIVRSETSESRSRGHKDKPDQNYLESLSSVARDPEDIGDMEPLQTGEALSSDSLLKECSDQRSIEETTSSFTRDDPKENTAPPSASSFGHSQSLPNLDTTASERIGSPYTEPGPLQDGSTTSCVAAAKMIAGMRGVDAIEEIQGELGCPPHVEDCRLKNWSLFEVMEV